MVQDSEGNFKMYTLEGLRNARNALSRELQDHGQNIDLTTDPKFVGSRKAFKDALKELKENRKAVC